MAVQQPVEVKKGKGKTTYFVIMAILCIGIPLQCFTFFWMLSNAFKTSGEIIRIPPTLFPQEFYNGFSETFSIFKLWKSIWNTIILCVSIITIQVTISGLAAFSLSKLKPKYGKAVLLFFVGTMMISPQALMFPLYLMMTDLGLINNFWSYILASSAWAYSIFLFKGFFDSLPQDLVHAARIDGAGSMRIFTQIILPLSKPVMAVNILNTFMAVYNDYIMPMMLLPKESNWTIMMRVFIAQSSSVITMNNLYIMLTVTVVPVIIIYLFAQNSIVEGISMSGLKG